MCTDAFGSGMVDVSESHLRGHGFDPKVCEGCPEHQTEKVGNPCGQCGCPTTSVSPMNFLSAPPESCLRLDQHEGK